MDSRATFPDAQPLPDGCTLLRLDAAPGWPAVCAVLRTTPPAIAPRPVLLRTNTDASVWLGAVCDARSWVLRWVEIWVQRTTDAPGLAFGQTHLSNGDLDERWERLRRTFLTADPGRCLVTGGEDQPSAPVTVGEEARGTVVTDDAALTRAGHEAWHQSRRRWMRPGGTDAWQELPAPAGKDAVVFNPSGGRILLRHLPSLTLEDYLQLLTTGQLPAEVPWLGEGQAKRDLRHFPGAFLQGWTGDRPPLGEVVHLKTRLLTALTDAVAGAGNVRRAPLLHLMRSSWGIEWPGPDTSLSAWNARPVLLTTPAVIEWHQGNKGAEPVFFLNPEHHAPSLYTHPGVKPPRLVDGSVRLRDLRPLRHERGLFECEGTLLLSDNLPALTDQLLIDCPLSRAPMQASIVSIEPQRGEVVFKSAPWQATVPVTEAVEAGGYTPPPLQCQCALVPRLGAAADLYSLGVLALEILCCSRRQMLPLALDELVRLGRRLEQENTPLETLSQALAAWARRESDAAWVETLHPRHLVSPAIPAETAWRAVAPEVWYSLLAACLRLLTGQTRYAWFAHPGEGGVATRQAFAEPLAALAALTARTRGLAVMDWESAREIREEILTLLK